MTAASRVPQLVATYTYITGSDKPAIKCRVLFFRGFEDLRSVLLTLAKRKKGRKEERGKRKMRESKKKLGKARKKLLISYFLWTRKRNRVPNVPENT